MSRGAPKLSSAARRCVLSRRVRPSTKDVRYLDIHEDDLLDEAQLTAWVKQASLCPANECEREVARCVRG
jgi:hypothetical protein